MRKESKIKTMVFNCITHVILMIKLTRAHIGLVVLPSFWLGSLFALLLGFEFDLLSFLIGFMIIFLIYASASFINDYYDYESDKYNRQFGFSGGSGVLQKHPELKEITKWSAISSILISLALTFYLVLVTSIPYWSIGYIGLGAFFSYFYSAPPLRFSYRGIGEFPHFLAGIMNTGWGYLLFTGIIDLDIIIFSIPLSLHLLTVILIFEIPDKEADIHGGKQNFIVQHGRKASFLLVSIIFWISTFIYMTLALIGWYAQYINFWIPAVLSLVPSIASTIFALQKKAIQKQPTRLAIRTAISLFSFSLLMLLYFIYLQWQNVNMPS